MRLVLLALLLGLAPSSALAQDVLSIDEVLLDRPTVITLGVQVLITGDDDHDARIDVRYRALGASAFRNGMSLHRVRPEVSDMVVPEQFAGSLFELDPATTYEIELHAVDPDGLDEMQTVMGTTRAIPGDPATPRSISVTDAASLQDALDAATAGDVITLAAGTYAGNFSTSASGTEAQPIVIRGADATSVILDGGGCTGCNVLEIYGSHVHLESLTIQSASRALRFQGSGAIGNVVRRVRIRDVTLGIGSRDGQQDFYLCDNDLEGRLSWPSTYRDDGGAHANDDGIHVEGEGHVICHNRIIGFGDAMKIETDLARSVDFYGNLILSAYDNGVELDAMAGNGRVFRNLFVNTYATMSVQPIYGGPVYLLRNGVVNVADEQIKWHGIGTGTGPSGVIVLHNTFITPGHAIQTSTSATSHFFVLMNNLFVGSGTDGRVIEWDAPIDQGVLDYDGFAPDGEMMFRSGRFPSFAAMQADGTYEPHGVLVTGTIFEHWPAALTDYTTAVAPDDTTLTAGSGAIDRGTLLTGVDDDFTGAAPDLGALERGCAVPIYGVRAAGTDETNEPRGCDAPLPGLDGGPGVDAGTPDPTRDAAATADAGGRDGGSTPGVSGGCGCGVARAPSRAMGWLLALLGLAITLGRARRRS